MNDYQPGAVKQHRDSLAVALRTNIPDPDKAWCVSTVDRGAHYTSSDEVHTWPDLHQA